MSNNTLDMTALEIAAKTDPGRDPDKQVNEDNYVHVDTPLGALLVVCDGMGGHAGGKEAAELAVRTIVERMQAPAPGVAPRDVLKRAIEEANAQIVAMPTAEPGFRPGSTVVASLVHAGGAEIAHVGDSRIYLVHAGAISQVTRDHSMVQEMVDRNLIRAEDAAKHPDANKILRALGIAKEVEVDIRAEPIPYVAGDILILCSDGLSDLASHADILDIAGSHPPAQAAPQLVDLANARGGHDNITALVARFKTSAAPRDPSTIQKTVQLTAAPPDPGSGPKGTLLSAPIQNPAPISPGQPHGRVAIPRAPSGPDDERPRSPAMMIVGIVLAVVGLGFVGVILWILLRPVHHNPRLVDDGRDAALHEPDDDDAGPDPEVAPAPPLVDSAPKPHGPHHHKDGDASAENHRAPMPTAAPSPIPPLPPAAAPLGEPPPCVQLRAARAKGLPAAVVRTLEEKCRAAGGTP